MNKTLRNAALGLLALSAFGASAAAGDPVKIPTREGKYIDWNNADFNGGGGGVENGGANIGSTRDNTNVTFNLKSDKEHTYQLTIATGHQQGTAVMDLSIEAGEQTLWSGTHNIENTGSWTPTAVSTFEGITLPAGEYVLRLKARDLAGSNYAGNWGSLALYDPNDDTVYETANVTFAAGDYVGEGILPANADRNPGETLDIPANFTMYVPGKTLTGWTDGENVYPVGKPMTCQKDVTLTPVFTDNKVSLADRKDAVTLRWDFQRKNGAPVVAWEGKDGLYWVTQATINGETIDVALPFSTKPGKCNNANWNDLAQLNGGTTFKVPACKGAVISLSSYYETTTTTIDGELMGDGSKTPAYTIGYDTPSVDLVIGDGSYFSWIQAVLPYVEKDVTGVTYENEDASVVWAFNNGTTYETDIVTVPEGAFSFTEFNPGVNTFKRTASTTIHPELTYVEMLSKNGGSDMLEWTVKPQKGLTFTPTRVSFYISRDGTDGTGGDVTVQGRVGDQTVTFQTITPIRNNKTFSDDKHKDRADLTDKVDYTLEPAQQEALTSGEGFTLTFNNGFANTKGLFLSDIQIHGLLNGTVEEVEKFTVAAGLNIEDAGTVTVAPKAPEYDKDSQVKLSTKKNFGYNFVNWTDAAGNVVSEETEFVYTVAENSVFTANYEKINTYELAVAVNGGANLYQVELTPAPTVIDGKNMYEEGVKVTAKANSNEVITFTNWADGQNSAEIVVAMDGDKSILAQYDAKDFIVVWDFYQTGGNGRPADFCAADNDDVALVLRNAEGETAGWLDKSTLGAGGYESLKGAAVNWRTGSKNGDVGNWYWQTKVNAASFKDIKVKSTMLYNYNAYQKQNIEYSLDGENWTTAGTIFIEGAKNAVTGEFALPAEANNKAELYIRWISDKTSTVDGTGSANDGIALGETYITGTMELINDGTAPVLVSHIPAEGADNASINGKIVLTFDEKVKVDAGTTAKLNDLELEPTVTGKTVMFAYKNLTYSTEYTFTLPAGSVMDLTDNTLDKAITFKFATKTRPAVEKALYDAVVTNVDELVAALDAAAKRDDSSKRFRIFIHNGEYKLPASTTATKDGSDGKAYPDPTTYLNSPNVSFIGESMDGVVITNIQPEGKGLLEGIGKGDVIRLNGSATNTYWQDLTIKSAMGDAAGRDIELNDNSDKTIMKDVCLWGYQDTYVSNNQNGRFYFEGGVLRGRTDYLCGKGDVFYKDVTLRMVGDGGYITAPSQCKKYGYVFKDCEIIGDKDGVDGNYTLGRPWGSGTPTCIWIDTKMTVKPSAAGWGEMSGGYPARFAEYNSTTATGTVIDLSSRKTTFGDGHSNNPVLTAEEAAEYSYTNVMGADDDWDPATVAEQAPAPAHVYLEEGTITWDNSDYASLWAVCADGKVVAFTTEPAYVIEGTRADAKYSVRAANEMGGLGEAVLATDKPEDGVAGVAADAIVATEFYTLDGIRVSTLSEGLLLRVDTLANGQKVARKVVVRK